MKYRSEIDGLRALAIIPVILFHAGFKAFSGGFVGVDVFFVISGYLITTIIITEMQAGTFSIVNFYERRARRILPALFLVMFACLPFAWMWLFPTDMKDFTGSLAAVAVCLSNFLFYHRSGYFDTASELNPLIHTWSLAVEEQYYVLFPFFLLLTWKLGKRWSVTLLSVIALISLGAAQWYSQTRASFDFFMLSTRSWEIFIGSFVAFYYTRHNIYKQNQTVGQLGSLFGFVLIIYAIFAFNNQTPFPSLYTLAPTLGAALIIIFATHKTLIGKLLGTKLFLGLGLISYSAYLWHQPLFAFARHRSSNAPSLYLMAALSIVAILLAYLSWKYVERPFRNKHRFSRKQVFAYGAIGSALFITIGFFGKTSNGFDSRINADISRTLHPSSSWSFNQTGCNADPGDDLQINPSCELGKNYPIVGALIGDSHAIALAHEFGLALNYLNVGALQITHVGCPPIFDVYNHGNEFDCDRYSKLSFNYIQKSRALNFVVLSSRWTMWLKVNGFDNEEGGVELDHERIDIVADGKRQTNSEELRKVLVKKKIVQSITKYIDTGKKIILIYPIPEAGWNVPMHTAKNQFFNRTGQPDLSTSYNAYQNRNQETIDLLDSIGEHNNLIRIYPDKVLCNTYIKNRCVAELNGVPLYTDESHLSNVGARIIVKEIMRHIGIQ